jgi:hypothetical protein
MATYKIDGRIFKTGNCVADWDEDTTWDGRNHISVATGSQWDHEKLYKSAKGTYWMESWSNWQGTVATAEIMSAHDAAVWLATNGHEIPSDLDSIIADLEE